MLAWFVTGYATLREFYNLRDHQAEGGSGESSADLVKRQAAFEALLAVIASASDPIQGGLYDDERPSVVQVDSLLCLLGEALPFLADSPFNAGADGSEGSSLEMPQPTQKQLLTLLRAIEALDIVDKRIYHRCEDAFKVCMASYRHQQQANESPDVVDRHERALLSKQISAFTTSSSSLSHGSATGSSSGFLLTGSEMLDVMSASEMGSFGDAGGGSQYSSKGRRPSSSRHRHHYSENHSGKNSFHDGGEGRRKKAWDWRKGLEALERDVAREVTGKDVLRILRLRVERKLGEVWARGR